VSNQGEIALLFNGDASTKEKLFQKIFMVPNTTKLRDTLWNNYIKAAPPEYPVKDTTLISSEIQCVEKLIEMATEELSTLKVDEDEYNKLITRKAYLDKVEQSQADHQLLSTDLEKAKEAVELLSAEVVTLQAKMETINIGDYRDCVAAQKAAKPLYENKQKWLAKKTSLTAPTCAKVDETDIAKHRNAVAELEAELKTKRDEAEQEALQMYQRAVAQSQEVTDEANANFAEASARAAELMSEAERMSREANQNAAALAEDSQRTATNVINQARRRAEALSRRAESLANNAIKESEDRLSRMKGERIEIEEFLSQLRNLMSTDAMVADAENRAYDQ
jgi:hypothetical protein